MTQHEVIKRFIEFSKQECSFRAKESVLSYHYRFSFREYRKGLLQLASNIDDATVVLAYIYSLEGVLRGPKGGEITVNMTDYGTTFTNDFAQIRNALISELDLKSIPYMKADNVPQWKTSSIMRVIKDDPYIYTKDYTKDHIIYFDNVYTKADKLPKWSDISLYKYIVRRAPNNQAELTFTEPTDIVIFDPSSFITRIDWISSNWGWNMPFPHITEITNPDGHIVCANIIDLGTGEVIGHLYTSTNTFSVAALSDIKRAFPDTSQEEDFTCCAIIRGFTGVVRTTRKNENGELVIIGNGNINFKTEITGTGVI